jgi:hypothetical protein
MILLTPDLRYALRANAISSVAAQAQDMRFDPVPVVKFFNPIGAGTWLATELYGDDDTCSVLPIWGSDARNWAFSR